MGETTRADMTFSVAKSYLAILAGLVLGSQIDRDPHEEVRYTVGMAVSTRRTTTDHLASPAAADLGVGGRAVGQARSCSTAPVLCRPAEWGTEGDLP